MRKNNKGNNMKKYSDFLKSKIVIAKKTGITIDAGEISPALKPHQRDAVMWSAAGGRRAIFAAFGLGKGAASSTNTRAARC